MTPAALIAQQHVRQQRQQQLLRQHQVHQVPSTAAGRPVESLKEQQRRLAGKGVGHYQLKPTPFRPLV